MDSTDNISRSGTSRPRPSLTPLGPRTPSRTAFDLLPSTSSGPGIFSQEYLINTTPPYSPRTLPGIPEVPAGPQPLADAEILPPAYSALPETQVEELPRSPSLPPRIPPAPAMRFEPQPVEWKPLSLEAALWTFSSTELQQIVSRAIRSSAGESFIRLLTIENLDNIFPAELERLEKCRASAQARYRFLVHRRTMLLQALITSMQIPSMKAQDKEDTMASVTKLALQLSETTTDCDRLLEELMSILDRSSQINRMLDVHWASALAIALRKLNTSHGRRTTELREARERIIQLEAGLEDAWKEAAKLAQEIDNLEADLVSDQESIAIVETAEVVSVPNPPDTSESRNIRVAPTLMTVGTHTPRTPISPRHAEPMADIPADVNGQEDNQDNLSIRSGKSAKSTKSARSAKSAKSTRSHLGEITRSQYISAARKRSYRVSRSGLRLPLGFLRKQGAPGPRTPIEECPPVPGISTSHSRKQSTQSTSRSKASMDEQPPVPDIPLKFTSVYSSPAANASSTLLHWDGQSASSAVPITGVGDDFSSSRRVPVHLDDINLNDDNEVEVSHSPYRKNMSFDDIIISCRGSEQRRSGIGASPTSIAPSIWRNIDIPGTPAERVESLRRHGTTHNKPTPYQKLRALTRRYSHPFPLFASTSKSVASHRSSD